MAGSTRPARCRGSPTSSPTAARASATGCSKPGEDAVSGLASGLLAIAALLRASARSRSRDSDRRGADVWGSERHEPPARSPSWMLLWPPALLVAARATGPAVAIGGRRGRRASIRRRRSPTQASAASASRGRADRRRGRCAVRGTPGGAVALAGVRATRATRRDEPLRSEPREPGRRDRRRHAGRRSAVRDWADAQGTEDALLIVGVLGCCTVGAAAICRPCSTGRRDAAGAARCASRGARAHGAGPAVGRDPRAAAGRVLRVPPADVPTGDARGDRNSARRDGARRRPRAGDAWRSCGSGSSWRCGDGGVVAGVPCRRGRRLRGGRRRPGRAAGTGVPTMDPGRGRTARAGSRLPWRSARWCPARSW